MMKYALSLLAILLLSGCASQKETAMDTRIITLAPDVALTLPQSPDLPRPIEVSQLVIGTYGDRKFALQVRLSGDAKHFDMVGLDMSGQRTIGIEWTASGISYETASWIPSQLAPDYILADLILIYWPPEEVRCVLNGSGILTATYNHRSIMKDGAAIIDIDYQPHHGKDIWQETVHYKNLARGYSIDIQSTRVAP
jgi:hypothetical protein